MEDLVDCFSLQSSRYVRIQECLKDCVNVLQTFESSENEAVENKVPETYRNILSECRKKLVNEQLESINDRQKWIKAQNQLQKIFSDYKSALYELEVTQEENNKLATLHDKNTEERLQQAKDLEKLLVEEKKAIVEAAATLSLEQLAFVDEKKSVNKHREAAVEIQIEYTANLEKLKQERLSLAAEKSALDRQSKLYEAQENTLLKEKNALSEKCEELNEKISELLFQLDFKSQVFATDVSFSFK